MKGHVSVEMLVLFGYMVSLTYRFVFDGDICSLSVPASTDHIIAMLSAHLSAEHWSRNEGEEETNINLEIKDFKISGLSIDADGNVRSPDEVGELYLVGCSRVFDELSVRYKRFIKDRCSSYSKGISREERLFDSKAEHSGNNSYMDLHYAMVDIWENVSHPDSSGCDLFSLDRPQPLDEEQIVQHIKDFHKEELIGLMSLYPEEWLRSYDEQINLYDEQNRIKEKIERLIVVEDENADGTNEEQQSLSAREKEIVVCVVKGMTNREIADRLFLSTHTVITHRRNIARKLQIHSPSGLTIYAIVNKLVELSDIK